MNLQIHRANCRYALTGHPTGRIQGRFQSIQGMVPEARLELALCFQNRILNPACLPIPPLRRTPTSVGIFEQNDKCREFNHSWRILAGATLPSSESITGMRCGLLVRISSRDNPSISCGKTNHSSNLCAQKSGSKSVWFLLGL